MVKSEESSKKLSNFFESFRLYRYKKGEIILRPFESPRGVFYLKSGYVRLYSVSEDGQELSLIIFKPGDFFPVIWLINNTQNQYYIDSLTPSALILVPKDKFLDFIKSDMDVLFELTSRSLFRLGGLLERMNYLVYGNAGQKLASIILILAQRFAEEKDKDVEIPIPTTHKDLANLLGVSRETVSIEVKKFERKNLIEIKNRHLIIKNKKLLEKEAILA